MDVLEQIKKDEVYQKYRRIVRGIRDDVDLDKMLEEAQGLFRTRKTRTLYGRRPSASELYEAQQQEMMVRSRIVEMSAQLHLKIGMVERANKTTKNHLIATYGPALKTLAGTATDRNSMVKRILKLGIELLDRLNKAVSVLDMLVTDIDKSGYGITNSVAILKLLLGKPGQTEI
jgi:hypothetical protein